MRNNSCIFPILMLSFCLFGQTAPYPGSLADSESVRRPESGYGMELPPGVLFGKFEKDNGPFLIKGSVTVPAGEVLEFGPGCKIFVGGKYATITVFGQINVKGTADAPVIFQSAQKEPNPWDWDRIYCRSKSSSVFEHCIIRHSNYGIFVDNGSLSIAGCLFENNSLHGLVVRNSDVNISHTTFSKGQVLAVYCMGGANVSAESLSVNGNITGIGCDALSHFEMKGGRISNNSAGLVAMKGSFVSILGGEIMNNKTGIITQEYIPRKSCEMVYSNSTDMKVGQASEMGLLFRQPEEVKNTMFTQSKFEDSISKDFITGFSVVKEYKEAAGSFIGNVNTGFTYFDPHSHSIGDTFALQTRYPGENSSGISDNIQPELQVFANGKRGDANIDLLLDVYGNEYMGFRRNMTSLSLNYANQELVLGDFYENFSETSINGRKLTGIKFDGNYFEMGKGEKRINVQAAFGQSEMAKEVGDHELDLYNQDVDTGTSIRQQLTYVASVLYKPSLISTIGVKGIIARDQAYNTFIGGKVIKDDKAPGLVEAQTGSIDGKIDLFDGKLSLMAELDMGTHDTIYDSVDSKEVSKIAWYDPQVPEAISDVFSAIPTNENYSFSLGATGLLEGYNFNVNFLGIAPDYFSAGNPYLDIDRRMLSAGAEKEFTEHISGNLSYEYELRDISGTSPTDNHYAMLSTKYGFGTNLPELSLGYTLNFESTPFSENVNVAEVDLSGDTIYSSESRPYTFRDIKNIVSIEEMQQLSNGLSYSIRYQMLYENDFTEYVDTADKNKRDGLQHQANAWLSFKVGTSIRNKVAGRYATQNRVQDSLDGCTYRISDEFKVSLLARKLSLRIKGEYGKRVDNKYNSETAIKRDETTLVKGVETEIKYSFTSRASMAINGRYEQNEDTETITDNYTVYIFGMHFMYLF